MRDSPPGKARVAGGGKEPPAVPSPCFAAAGASRKADNAREISGQNPDDRAGAIDRPDSFM
jgi:hypothetical protein